VKRLPAPLLAVLVIVCAAATSSGSAAAAATPPLPECRYLDRLTRYRDPSQWRRTLLDTNLRVGRSYAPDDLVSVSRAGIAGSGRVRELMIDDLRALASAARAAGHGIAVRSAYRSFQTQKAVFNDWVDRLGYERALEVSARAGHSEHQLGTTIDFRSASSTRAPWDYADWGATGPGRWMRSNAWRYGFVMSYPRGRKSVSCYAYEPWHFRYVGRRLARRVHEQDIVLRRFLWRRFETAS
jgi:D-alanyl-D-alanine carboxypeptidase